MVLDIFALVVIALLIAVVIWLVVLLGNMPGDIARKRNHPQSQAISALLQHQDTLTAARGQVITNLVATYKALGGGWQLREGSNYVRPDLIDAMMERTDWGELLKTSEQPDSIEK